MPRIRLILSDGAKIMVDKVEIVEFERVCPYNGHTFYTASLTRIHCSDSHANMFRRKVPPELRETHNTTELTHIPA